MQKYEMDLLSVDARHASIEIGRAVDRFFEESCKEVGIEPRVNMRRMAELREDVMAVLRAFDGVRGERIRILTAQVTELQSLAVPTYMIHPIAGNQA